MPPPRIAIVGGGPAGLTLGVLLHRQNIPFTIFELRKQPTEADLARPSGMLDLHPGSGLDAIEACGLTAEFGPLTGECSQQFLIANRAGEVLMAADGGGKRPEISRNNLSKLLSTHVPPESIRWGHRLAAASKTAAGTTALDFGDNGSHTFDLVVGADGAWSRVRALLSDTRPHFTGMHCVTVTVTHLTSRFPHLAALVGSGSYCVLGRRHAVVSQRGPLDSARLYLWLTVADEAFAATRGLAGKPARAAKQVLLGDEDLLATFGPRVRDLVTTACDEDVATDRTDGTLDIRPFYTLPYGWSWPSQPGVTLVGDAAHLMLPNGEGVNQAMLDALLLSKAVAEAYRARGETGDFITTLSPLLQSFEKDMLARAVKEGEETDQRIGLMFGSDDAACDFVAAMKGMVGGDAKEGTEE
ncbi:salicylate hydroxylase [Sporothrix brasiliensis 5110]|uniref:Salicylate hydroxylase n=1 Tax=Sporothrix brasiliensis 5110 TaxID=1398154 RepID=A0A0C2F2W1_9PEZI|nr:salicylate hydroxylase [Sporothrix brasiliensis 5110]KIH93219.1 salicylate hydroxylase [Sporothrix brasiliensis 5110]